MDWNWIDTLIGFLAGFSVAIGMITISFVMASTQAKRHRREIYESPWEELSELEKLEND